MTDMCSAIIEDFPQPSNVYQYHQAIPDKKNAMNASLAHLDALAEACHFPARLTKLPSIIQSCGCSVGATSGLAW